MTKKVAVIGATGLVGKELIKILEQRVPSYSKLNYILLQVVMVDIVHIKMTRSK